jgi:hypothetical protein
MRAKGARKDVHYFRDIRKWVVQTFARSLWQNKRVRTMDHVVLTL